jgi:hypothetical protein
MNFNPINDSFQLEALKGMVKTIPVVNLTWVPEFQLPPADLCIFSLLFRDEVQRCNRGIDADMT